jgi:hypothetical protein
MTSRDDSEPDGAARSPVSPSPVSPFPPQVSPFRALVAVALLAAAWWLPDVRRELVFDVTYWDASPADAAELPAGPGPGLAAVARTRVVVIDGLDREVAAALPAWSSVCRRGLRLTVDVGFPTISLPVQVALWTGLTQQQTGVVGRSGGRRVPELGRAVYGRPLDPPLDRRGIPAQIPGSIAIAEDHGWIVRSLGFAQTLPAAAPEHPALDHDLPAWRTRWEQVAIDAVASAAPLVLVHVLRVDTAGHAAGIGPSYVIAAAQADALLGRLVTADPGARWFVVSDHSHAPGGGHGGEERAIRHVESCIAGPGVVAGTAPLVHVVDLARALADSTGATLDAAARGRPLTAAVTSPLAPDQAVPPIDLTRGVIALFVLAAGLALTVWGARRHVWLAPAWFVAAVGLVYLVHGEPTLSMGLTYRGDGRQLATAWVAALPLAAATTWLGLGRVSLARVVAAQLALPVAAAAAAMAAAGAWPVVLGAERSPTVPRYTAWMLALVLMVAHGAAAVALGVLARHVPRLFGRRAAAPPPRSEP